MSKSESTIAITRPRTGQSIPRVRLALTFYRTSRLLRAHLHPNPAGCFHPRPGNRPGANKTLSAFCVLFEVLRKAHLRNFPFGSNFNLEEVAFAESKHTRNDVRREHLNLIVEEQDLVIVTLPGK
jgi:hypothetical protein